RWSGCPLGDCRPGRQPGRSVTTLWPGRPIEGPLPDSAKYRLALQLGEREAVRYFPQQLGQRRAERAADRCQQLRGRFLLTALNLGQISQRDASSGRHLAEGATLPETQPPQRVAEQVTKQHHRSHSLRGQLGPSAVPGFTDSAGEGMAACSPS